MRYLYLIPVICLGLCAGSATAQDRDFGWSFEGLVGYERSPAYTGSDVYLNEAQLGFQAIYTARNGVAYSVGTGGLGVHLSFGNDLGLDVTLEYEPGRESADDPILAGLPDIRNTWELQGVLTAELGAFELGVGLQTDILNRGKGTVGFVGISYETELTRRLSFHSSLDVSFADSEHMTTEVGITPAVAALTGLSAYSAPGGYKGATLELGLDYAISDVSYLYSSVTIERYGSNMSDSPLIRDHGDATNTEFEIGIGFSF